jgi:hypothetical protein
MPPRTHHGDADRNSPRTSRNARGRDYITLRELSKALNRAEQTLRKLHCTQGEVYGIRLHKIGGRLTASVADTAALLNGSQK